MLGEIDLPVKALNTLTYADSSMFYNDMEYCQIVKEILSWVCETEATAYRNRVTEKGEHELFMTAALQTDILFKNVLL